MDVQYFQQWFQYNFWANRQLWKCAMQLSAEQFDQPLDYSVGSIHNQLAHMMGVESWWMHFLATDELRFVEDHDYDQASRLRAKWDEVEHEIQTYLTRLTPMELEREVQPAFFVEYGNPPVKVWQAMMQVLYHSMDHRAQTLAGIAKLGGPTFEQDYLYYLQDHPQA
ncbi:MAG: hypothetical protein MUF87_01025 [Anaerolineae bacterium]|jgi:uncharacterized damage-inducible protein DinB|nr:hypothetical protein [Anaerolineae bacterium]